MKNNNKTARQWFDELPAGLRSSAINASNGILLDDEYSCLVHAISCAFLWEHTEEGRSFWESFNNALSWAEGQDEITTNPFSICKNK